MNSVLYAFVGVPQKDQQWVKDTKFKLKTCINSYSCEACDSSSYFDHNFLIQLLLEIIQVVLESERA